MDGPEVCPACGRPLASRQEYCLECGARIVRPYGLVHDLGSAWRRRLGWYPGDWILPSLAALIVAAAGAAAAIASNGGGGAGGPRTVVALSKLVRAPAKTAAVPPGAKRARKGPPRRVRPGLIAWPAESGYTIVLGSFPISSGAAAKTKAQQALHAGLPQVGILISSRFASLHPGYYVVFSGIYGSLDDAQAALPGVTRRYPNAYAEEITR